jgi:hypothetical protein
MHQLCRNLRTGQLKYSIHNAWFSPLFVLVFMATAPVYGQGGPPMITDDPFTPENGHWENNIAVQFTGTTASKEIEIPAVDINYGYGDHVQLKIEMPIMSCLHSNNGSVIGSGNVKIGAKARFLDEEISGIAVSTYPQYEFKTSSIAGQDEAPQFFLPLEAAKTLGRYHFAAEAGYANTASGPDELVYGIVMGYDQSERCELLAELHGDNHIHAGVEGIIFNVGLTNELTPSFGFLASAGTTIYSPEHSRMFVAYLGIRWML